MGVSIRRKDGLQHTIKDGKKMLNPSPCQFFFSEWLPHCFSLSHNIFQTHISEFQAHMSAPRTQQDKGSIVTENKWERERIKHPLYKINIQNHLLQKRLNPVLTIPQVQRHSYRRCKTLSVLS